MNPLQLSILIPAAGGSRRLGQPKQLLRFGGGTLIQTAINNADSCSPAEIIVITGAHADEVRNAARDSPVHWVHNPEWPDGLAGSIALGAANIHPDSAGLLILLCDQWRIQTPDLLALVSAWHADPDSIIASQACDRHMPPVIFPSGLFKQLQTLKGDQGARSLLKAHPDWVTAVPLENAGYDLDTQDHLDLLKIYSL